MKLTVALIEEWRVRLTKRYIQGDKMLDESNALCDLALQALTAQQPSATEAFTFEDAKQMVRGAVQVYGGGYHGAEREAFKAGIQTAASVLENARRGDTQTAANLAFGLPTPPSNGEKL